MLADLFAIDEKAVDRVINVDVVRRSVHAEAGLYSTLGLGVDKDTEKAPGVRRRSFGSTYWPYASRSFRPIRTFLSQLLQSLLTR